MAEDGCCFSSMLPQRSVAGVAQDELLDPKELADADSCFCEFNGVDLHHKISRPPLEEEDVKGGIRAIPTVLLHGFGASAFSWDRVMQPLARVVMADVLAFDRPAFGLTSRTSAASSGLNPYSMIFSVLATLFFIDRLASEKKGAKALLIGHSAGCFVAVETYLKDPEKVAALVLVSPAIFAPLSGGRSIGKENGAPENRILRFFKALADIRTQLVLVIFIVLKALRDMAGSLFARALTAFLQSTQALMLVRMIVDKFGISAIRVSWFEPSKITDYVIQGYTKPLKAKGWERAFLEYTLALLTVSSSKKPPLSERLAHISCPVLIITGDSDRVVPAWNAKRLSLSIPGSSFEVIEECGHLPHEEKAEEFLMIVERFLRREFAVSDQPQSINAPAT
ncbi:hypothetical protein ZIOFF_023804 [Zingiber officinale]|uniref:AB hydrolase-1 domain-containing protein n=2 Tax=Zingiber officinale TaxID=94328 RepID=A0A8J5H751_ZINOF|nr:hypothetical protein ZIOFF_023804 [Zingiber officinale]